MTVSATNKPSLMQHSMSAKQAAHFKSAWRTIELDSSPLCSELAELVYLYSTSFTIHMVVVVVLVSV